MSSDIERRRKEIEAKKEKLAELRKIRATRDAERRGSSVGSPGRGTPDVCRLVDHLATDAFSPGWAFNTVSTGYHSPVFWVWRRR